MSAPIAMVVAFALLLLLSYKQTLNRSSIKQPFCYTHGSVGQELGQALSLFPKLWPSARRLKWMAA